MALETALLIVPPKEVQVFSYPLRAEYDEQALENKLPAHITLLYPFIPPQQVEQAIDKLSEVCARIPPFDITLDRYGRFDDALFLEPSSPEPVLALFRKLSAAFPEFPVYAGEHGPELHPHLTLARFTSSAEESAIQLPAVPSFTFCVDKIHLYLGSTEDDTPFIPRAVIPLSGK
jgi:2'-5' RNA ligase